MFSPEFDLAFLAGQRVAVLGVVARVHYAVENAYLPLSLSVLLCLCISVAGHWCAHSPYNGTLLSLSLFLCLYVSVSLYSLSVCLYLSI